MYIHVMYSEPPGKGHSAASPPLTLLIWQQSALKQLLVEWKINKLAKRKQFNLQTVITTSRQMGNTMSSQVRCCHLSKTGHRKIFILLSLLQNHYNNNKKSMTLDFNYVSLYSAQMDFFVFLLIPHPQRPAKNGRYKTWKCFKGQGNNILYKILTLFSALCQ